MRSRSEHEHLDVPSGDRDLQLLSEVEEAPEITQRELSIRTGISLGLTNILLRNMAQKGYLRIAQAGWKRWLYNLTPEGVSHKVRLTVSYVRRVLDHYQNVRQTLRDELEPLALTAESRIAIYGAGEFAELVYIGLKELGIEEIDVFIERDPEGRKFLGMPIKKVNTLQPDWYDHIVIALMGDSNEQVAEIQKLGPYPHKVVTFFNDPNPRRSS